MGGPVRTAAAAPRSFLVNTAVVAVVLGVLPFLWEAHLAWRVLGPLVAGTLLARAAVLVWRSAFSTVPRHLPAD